MKTPITFTLCLAFALGCAHHSAAQRRSPAARRAAAARTVAPRPAPRVEWTILAQPFNEDGASTTLVSLQPMPLGAGGDAKPALSFGVNLSYEGKSAANFRNVTLSIFSRSAQCWFPADSGLVLTPDGKPLTIAYRPDAKGVDGVAWLSSETESGPCEETLVAYISPATLAQLAAAKSLTGRIGAETFEFTPANLGALRDFVSRIAMPQLNPRTARPRPRR